MTVIGKWGKQSFITREFIADVGEEEAKAFLLAAIEDDAIRAGHLPLEGTGHVDIKDPLDPTQVNWFDPDTPPNMLVAFASVRVAKGAAPTH